MLPVQFTKTKHYSTILIDFHLLLFCIKSLIYKRARKKNDKKKH